jgi:Spy/CpxP family protein refolding chaperone
MKRKTIMLALAMLLAAATLAAAQPGWRTPGVRRGMAERGFFRGGDALPARMLLGNKEELGLNAEQVKRLSAMLQAHQEWAVKFGAAMRVKAMERRAAEAKGDNKAAEKLIREHADMRAEMQIARLRFKNEVRGVLTPEQAAKAAQLRKEARAQRRDGVRRRAASRLDQRRDRR